MARKKKHTPTRKNLDRDGRLVYARKVFDRIFAPAIAVEPAGTKAVRRYARYFGVGLETAAAELRLLGVKLHPACAARITASDAARRRKRRDRRNRKLGLDQSSHEWFPDSDHHYAFIAGYTSGGAPYGVTWAELAG